MDYTNFLFMNHEISLVVVMVLVLLTDLIFGDKNKKLCQYAALGLFLAHTVLGLYLGHISDMGNSSPEVFADMYITSDMHILVKNILNIGTFLVFMFAFRWNTTENKEHSSEFYFLTLSTLLGMYLMVSSGHFLLFYIGLETASIPLATLVAFNKKQKESAEAAAKYVLTAAFSSGVMLFGISMLYVSCNGSLYFNDILEAFDKQPLQIMAFACFIAGIGFKLSLVPFHSWTADTYQGAPTAVTAYLSVISKGAAAFALFCIIGKAFAYAPEVWKNILWWLIVITITIGNLFAIRQTNMKRFMAFSSISQAGYIMLGVAAGSALGMSSLVYYVLIYLFTNLAAFGVISSIENETGKLNRDDYDGLYETNPKLALVMMLAMFSLGGIPPFAGCFSKLFIFISVFEQKEYLLVFIALLNTVISLYYYLLVVKAMFIKDPKNPIATFKSDNMTRVGLVICTICMIVLGFISGLYQYIESISF